MTVWGMVRRELVQQPGSFLLCLAAGVATSGLLVAAGVRLAVHDARNEELLRRKTVATQILMEGLKTDVRNAMHRLGYNAIILPKDQPLADWYAEDYATRTMPESWATRIAEAHGLAERYLPRLRRKLKWTEAKRTVLVVGSGEEHVLEATVSKCEPLVPVVPRGMCRLGYELHGGRIQPGAEITIEGRVFRVAGCQPELGTKDDITIWMSLADAQELLDLQGCINEILIVEHADIWGNLPEVRHRVAALLPQCRVVEIASQTLARLHARREVAAESAAALRREREKQAALRAARRKTMAAFGVAGFLVCALWVGIFMFLNVRERRAELAILSAVGFAAGRLTSLVVLKALLMGLVAGLWGSLLGWLAGLAGAEAALVSVVTLWGWLAGAVALTVAASLLGSWLPALSAARLDPALILGRE